jgi:hypothetical protein
MGPSPVPDRGWLLARIAKFGPCGYGGTSEEYDRNVGEMQAEGLDRLLPTFRSLLADPDPEIRGSASIAILAIRDPRSIDLALAALGDPDPVVRWAVCERLYGYGDGRAVAPLIDRMKNDPEPNVRNTAAFSLGGIGDPAAIPDLIHAMENDFEEDEQGYTASHMAMTALDNILGTEHTRTKVSENLCTMPASWPPDTALIKEQAMAFYRRAVSP